MKKVDVIYSALIEGISNVCDNFDRMEVYWNNLDDEKKARIDGVSEGLLVEKQKLVRCKRDKEIYENYSSLKQQLSDFNQHFSDYPDFNYATFCYIINLSEKIFQNSSLIPDEEVSLELKGVVSNLSFEGSAYITNLSDINKTIAWFSPSCSDSLCSLVQYSADVDCWYALLHEVNNIDFLDDFQYLFYCKSHFDAGVSIKNVSTLLKLHMISSGMKTIPSPEYSRLPSNSSLELFCPSQSYIQFQDVIGILGEYNNRRDIFSKYLSIFHVIENFMFKEPIVRLERSSSGTMFSIRDFKRLYKSVDMDEQKALKSLFKEAFKVDFNGSDFKVFAYQEWQDFLTRNATEQSKINDFLCLLSITDLASVNRGSFYDFIARVVYQVRCSIVHNKETEFHVSSENYPDGCKLILEDFLLRFAEELIFLLVSKENSIVWYTSESIKLWSESA
ncbi:hypothetical protein ACR0ST_10275 [Aliidiomarina sp. Khilg15.8]